MKIALAVAAVLLFFASASRADSTTLYNVTSSIYEPCGFQLCEGPQLLNLQLTTELVTGYFDAEYIGMTFYGTFPVVTAMTGTFDGQYPVSLIPAQFGDGAQATDFLLSYDYLLPADLTFMADGSIVDIEYETDGILMLEGPPNVFLPGDMLSWDITKVPEPAPLLLSGIGLLALALFSTFNHKMLLNKN